MYRPKGTADTGAQGGDRKAKARGRAGQGTSGACSGDQRGCAQLGQSGRRRRTGHAPTRARARPRLHPAPSAFWAPPPHAAQFSAGQGPAPVGPAPQPVRPRPRAPGSARLGRASVRPRLRPQPLAPPPDPGHARASRAPQLVHSPALAAAGVWRLGQCGKCLGCHPPVNVQGSPWGERASGACGAVQP